MHCGVYAASDAIRPVPAQPLFDDGNSAPDSIVEQSRAVHHRLSTCSHPDPGIPFQDPKNGIKKTKPAPLNLDLGFQTQI